MKLLLRTKPQSCEPFARLEASRKAAIEIIDYDAEREEAMNEKFGIIDWFKHSSEIVRSDASDIIRKM